MTPEPPRGLAGNDDSGGLSGWHAWASAGERLMRTTAAAAESAFLCTPTPADALQGWKWE